MRLSPQQINEITGYSRKSAQAAWFRNHLAIEIPCDHRGPILTDEAYEKLLEKRLGILPSSSAESRAKPAIRLVHGGKK